MAPIQAFDGSPIGRRGVTRISKVLPTGEGQLSYTYHPATVASGAGLLQSITAPDGGIVSLTYRGSLLHQEAWDGSVSGSFSGSVERAFNNIGRIAAETVNQTNLISFGYDDDGFMTSAGALSMTRSSQNGLLTGTSLGTVSDVGEHNSFGELTAYTANVGSSVALDIAYERDQIGRITRKSESVQGATAVDTYYRYDPAGRLHKVCADEACTTIQSQYEYDTSGNRIVCQPAPNDTECTFTATHGAYLAAQYDNQDRLLSTETTSGSTTYTYTANGELLTKTDASGTTTYTYDALGNLLRVMLPNSDVIDYVIDGKNRRVGKKINGTLVQGFLWDGQLRIVAELDGSGSIVSRFGYGEKVNVPEYMVKAGVTYRILTDHLGSPRQVIRETDGTSVQAIDYDEFGNAISDTSPGFQPFGFAGGLYDPVTKLVRFGARDYVSMAGRWTANDPIRFDGGDANLYGYVLGDPINLNDPIGLHPLADSVGAIRDFVRQYLDMREANTKGADKRYHCMANCLAASRGVYGEAMGNVISEFRELTDQHLKRDPADACEKDRAANEIGRDAGSGGYSCVATCSGL